MAALHPLGIRESPARTLAAAFLLALLVHLPLTPFPFILRLLSMYLSRSDTSWDYQDDSVIIPISLVEDEPAAKPAQAVEPAPASTEGKPVGRPHGEDHVRDAGVADAGEPDGGKAVADAGRHRETANEAGATVAVLDAGENGEGGAGPSVKDTLSLVGTGLRRIVKDKQNVSLLFWFSTMREHPLGPLVGGLFACVPQWRDFLGDQIDPLQDLDGVWLFGPRMSDTSKVTIVVQSRMDDTKLQQVMGTLAAKPGGSIVDAGSVRAIRFRADRADRVALTHPPRTIIVTPPEGFEQLRDMRGSLALPAGHGQAMSLTLVTPWRPLRSVGAKLPETLSELRVSAFAAADGGVNVQIEFDDQDPASADAHAHDITEQARAAGGPLLGDIEFVAQGNHLTAQTHFSRITSAIVLGFFRDRLCPSPTFDGGRGAN